MNELQVFTNPEFGQVRTLTIEEEPWFVGKDVAVALGYSVARKAIYDHVDDEDKRGFQIGTPSGEQTMTIINESGLYALIFGSKLESAKRFKHWVTHDVLPAIRKTGSYSIIPKARALTTDDYMKAAQLAATCRNERLPYVLGFLEQAGFSIPEVTTPAPAFWPVVVFSYHFRRFPVVGGKQNRGKSWFLTHGKKGFGGNNND